MSFESSDTGPAHSECDDNGAITARLSASVGGRGVGGLLPDEFELETVVSQLESCDSSWCLASTGGCPCKELGVPSLWVGSPNTWDPSAAASQRGLHSSALALRGGLGLISLL